MKNTVGVSLCLWHKTGTIWGPQHEQQREEELPASPRAATPFCFHVQGEALPRLGCKHSLGPHCSSAPGNDVSLANMSSEELLATFLLG